MKCPKCGYLGFEQAERCRNCGYEFALAARRAEPELTLRDHSTLGDLADLDLADRLSMPAAAPPRTPETPRLAPPPTPAPAGELAELPLFTDDTPLITRASPPRPPLAVRRATPDVPRLRSEAPRVDGPKTPVLAFQGPEVGLAPADPVAAPVRGDAPDRVAPASPAPPAGLAARFLAAAIDLILLAIVDVVVVYLTVQICGLGADELGLLPLGPLVAFLAVQNGGYLVTFTAGGQTIGKMLTGIRVVAADPDHTLDLGRAFQRTLAWSFMALPAGLGLLSALMTADRRGLHDRFAGTRVVRSAA